MIERTSQTEPITTHWDSDDDPNHDTIVLLQEEIARLEAELQARDEPPAPPRDVEIETDDANLLDELRGRFDGLLAELAQRDEMVALLLEQSRLFEEAAEARRAEWEQLNDWVAEVERRVDNQDNDGPRLLADLDAERRRAEQLQRDAESDRQKWDAQRIALQHEAKILRDQLGRSPQGHSGRDDSAFIELAAENRELRTTCEALRKADVESEELGRRLASTLVELEQVRRDLRHLDDDLRRERNEHEAELGALRARHARELLEQQIPSTDPKPVAKTDVPAGRASATEADERIRAFRQHLKELHENEANERANRTLGSRLTRIWRKTGPA